AVGPLGKAGRTLVAGLADAVGKPVLARDVMSRPARSVEREARVAKAMVGCQRYGQSGILVTKAGRLIGAVRREDLDKAIGHGLAHAPVKGIMSGRVPTAAEDSTLAELQQSLIDSSEGRIAILRGEKVVGVVTRTDLLRALAAVTAPGPEPEESIAAELDALRRLAPVFDAIAATSEAVDGVYLVGGTVRDILLGERGFDVDVAVEGDAIALARLIGRALGGRVRAHAKFRTPGVVHGGREPGHLV